MHGLQNGDRIHFSLLQHPPREYLFTFDNVWKSYDKECARKAAFKETHKEEIKERAQQRKDFAKRYGNATKRSRTKPQTGKKKAKAAKFVCDEFENDSTDEEYDSSIEDETKDKDDGHESDCECKVDGKVMRAHPEKFKHKWNLREEYFKFEPAGYRFREMYPLMGKFKLKVAVFHASAQATVAAVHVCIGMMDRKSKEKKFKSLLGKLGMYDAQANRGCTVSGAQHLFKVLYSYAFCFQFSL